MKKDSCKIGKPMVGPALIVIPDISGFTAYMSSSDLAHSQVKIASLLETIIESNTLGWDLSEIEGDAVLFYSFHNESTAQDILSQCKRMLRHFHEKLLEFKKDKCQCRSCQKLHSLTLKFVIHCGSLGSIMIKDYCKLFGKDLIIAHRLLKNKLPMNEYLLLTEAFARSYITESSDKVIEDDLKTSSVYIPDVGKVNFSYTCLKKFL